MYPGRQNLKANQGALEALVRLCSDAGCMTLDGSYDLNRETYNGELTLSRFPLDRFLTVDSLGSASANFRLEGRYFSWPQAKTSVNAGIRQLFYKEHEYKDITLQATLDKTHLRGTMVSKDPDAPLDLVFRGDSLQQQYQVGLGGYIGKVDLQALHLMQESLTMGLKVDLQGFIGEHSAYALKARFDSLSMADSRKTYTLGSLDIDMASDLKKTTLDVKTGDLQLTFRADTSLAGFGESAGKIAGIVGKQIAGKDIDMEQIKAELPVFSMHLKGDQNNAIAKFLKARNRDFVGFLWISFPASGQVSGWGSRLRLPILGRYVSIRYRWVSGRPARVWCMHWEPVVPTSLEGTVQYQPDRKNAGESIPDRTETKRCPATSRIRYGYQSGDAGQCFYGELFPDDSYSGV